MNRGKLLAGALGDLSDHSSARTTGDFALNLANAEVGGRSKRFDLTDDALLGGWPAQMLSSDLGGPHAGGHAFADERGLQFGHGADDGEHRSTHWAVGVYLILDADEAHAEMVELFKRYQQVACAACKAVEFPDQHAVDLVVSDRRHQGVELRSALPTA